MAELGREVERRMLEVSEDRYDLKPTREVRDLRMTWRTWLLRFHSGCRWRSIKTRWIFGVDERQKDAKGGVVRSSVEDAPNTPWPKPSNSAGSA
jgi:hypothetical protein